MNPVCLRCAGNPEMTPLDNITGPAIYGLVPLTDDQAIQTGVPPIPTIVFECTTCGVLALFRSRGTDSVEAARTLAEEVNTGIIEELNKSRELESFLDAPGE